MFVDTNIGPNTYIILTVRAVRKTLRQRQQLRRDQSTQRILAVGAAATSDLHFAGGGGGAVAVSQQGLELIKLK